MITAGVDLGSHVVHIGIIQGHKVVSAAHLDIDKSHSPEALDRLMDSVSGYFQLSKIERLIAERPLVFAGVGYPIHQMAELLTIVKLSAYANGLDEIDIVTPAQWRKKVLGTGKANKKDAIEYVRQLGWQTKDHNEAESICIACY